MSTYDIGSSEETCELWATAAQKDVKFWCNWNTGRKCNCKNCPSQSMLQVIAWYCYIFHIIDKDRLV